MLYGAVDINRDGYIVHTTLDMEYQKAADEIMERAYADINTRYQNTSENRLNIADKQYIPIVELLSLTFNLRDIQVAGSKEKRKPWRSSTMK